MYQKKAREAKPWIIIACVIVAFIWLLYTLGDVLAPLIVAAVLAYVLNPLAEWLQLRRTRCVPASMIIMASTLLVLLPLVLIIVSVLLNQFNNLAERLPQTVGFIQNRPLSWFNSVSRNHIQIGQESIIAWLQSHTDGLSNTLKAWIPTLMHQSGNVIGGANNLVLLSLLLCYFSLDWKHWSSGISKSAPRRFIETHTHISSNTDGVLGKFLRGQLMVTTIMGSTYGLGLMLAGSDSGFAIGMIAGILVFIPYLGAFTSLLLTTVAVLLQYGSWQGLLMARAVFGAGQFLESFFITPKIVGDRIGLSPFWVTFLLMAFGQLMGSVSMFAGLPLVAVTLVLLHEGASAYFGSHFYKYK